MFERRENRNCWLQEEGLDDGYPKVKNGGQESRKTNMCTLRKGIGGAERLRCFFDGKNAGDMIR